MLFKPTKEHEELRNKMRAFAEKEVKPIAFSMDQENGCLLYTSRCV